MNAQDQTDLSSLSVEQVDTDRLIRQLLGTAVADRYVDFCRLASGTLPLIVSRPLAGHALRELDSLVRHVLATPMDARAPDNAEEAKCRREARVKLKEMGFDELVLQRVEKALMPRYSHKKQIQQIVGRLGLTPDGDIVAIEPNMPAFTPCFSAAPSGESHGRARVGGAHGALAGGAALSLCHCCPAILLGHSVTH
jgi:hypothetical protein